MKTKMKAYLLPMLACALLPGCTGSPPPPEDSAQTPNAAVSPVVYSANEFQPADRAKFYHLHEGSELFPVVWLIYMRDDKGERLVDHLDQWGLIADPEADTFENTNIHMPVGIAVAERPGLEALSRLGLNKMVGVNCAACHVGQLEVGGKKFRVDGAPNMFDIVGFFQAIANAADRTYKNPIRLWKYVQERLKANSVEKEVAALDATTEFDSNKEYDALKQGTAEEKAAAANLDRIAGDSDIEAADVNRIQTDARGPESVRLSFGAIAEEIRLAESYINLLRNFSAAQNPETVAGFGRADAFGTARALLFPPRTGSQRVPLSAPSSFPFIWNMERTAWFHWTANTNSVIQRNIGQALGLGASFDPKSYRSTIDFVSLFEMEQLAYKTRPPRWPEDLFGKIDQAKADLGKPIYEQQCANCHDRLAKPYANDPSLTDYPVLDVKTDPEEAKNWGAPVTFPGSLVRDPRPSITMEFGQAQSILLKLLFDQAMKDLQAEGKNINMDWESGRKFAPEWRIAYVNQAKQLGYPAKPLAGIWATAPFLHNGSVPTLADLLEPVESRPPSFILGAREYDAKKLGYNGQGTFIYDTTKVGNSRAGHVYGTTLTPEQKGQLLEYLKQL